MCLKSQRTLSLAVLCIVLLLTGVCFGQAELNSGDTTTIVINGGGFNSKFHRGQSYSIGFGILGRFNFGFAQTHWSKYTNSATDWWGQTDYTPGAARNTQSGYLEFLPMRKTVNKFSASAGIAFLFGNDAGLGKGSYRGFAGSAYGTLQVLRAINLSLRFGEAYIIPRGQYGPAFQQRYGGSVYVRASSAVMLISSFDYAVGLHLRLTTISGGLAFLLPR